MDITFNPPIGDSIELEISFALQTALLHFTAELTPLDHDKLIQDRARIQLWSDLPRSDGGWGALDFTYQTQATEELSSSHKISLGSTWPIIASEEKVILFLEVVVPLPLSRNPHFSFTYRILYPSGDIQWLGHFGQNGSLSFERSDHDLHNFNLHSWTFDKSRMAHVYEIKQPVTSGTLVVARVRDMCNYCVRAMGPTSFVSDLKKAALLFFVPRSQPSAISLLPTYVFSASPGSSLTLSADGHITASGSGTILFQANEGHLEPLTFIRQILSHAELDSWDVLSWDAGSKVIALASPRNKLPINAVTIPLWHSKALIRPIYLNTSTLSNMLGSTEFSIFSPDNMRIHLFIVDPQATEKNQMVALQSDNTGNILVISPIHTLRDYQAATHKSTTIWKTVILSPYAQDFSSDDSGILPTPPPSPHFKTIACLSQTHPSSDTATSSVPSLPSDTCISLQSPLNGKDEPETSPNAAVIPDTNVHDALKIQKNSNLPSTQSIIAIFRSLLYSIFFGVYLILWGHRNSSPGSLHDTTKDRLQSQASTGREDNDDLSPLGKDIHDDPGDDSHASESLSIPETKTLLEGNIEIQTTNRIQSDAKLPEGNAVLDVSSASNNTKGDIYYLQSEPGDSTLQKKATIALLCTTHNDSSTAEDNTNAPSVINKNRIMNRCVRFLDGFEPECVVSRCNVDIFSNGRAPGERGGESSTSSGYSCSLLQYQLDWDRDLEKSERMIRILPPGVDLLD